MLYQIGFLPVAARQLQSLPVAIQKKIIEKINYLTENPRPPQSKLLKGKEGYRRIRVGDYRVIYGIEDDQLIILVVRIGHRREVYR